jgi:hypothetical protein
VVRQPPPAISGPNQLWWFNGASPGGSYHTSIVLTSGTGSVQWTISAGGHVVSLSAMQGESVIVSSIGASDTAGDVRITATNSSGQGHYDLTVRTPHRLQPGDVLPGCPSQPFGYRSLLEYTIIDQFNTPLPAGIGVNEFWTSGVTDHVVTNWRRDSPKGVQLITSTFVDEIGGEHVDWVPVPPVECGNTTQVQSWGQAWRVGSSTPGAGKSVQNNTLMKRRGSAVHLSLVSPVTP